MYTVIVLYIYGIHVDHFFCIFMNNYFNYEQLLLEIYYILRQNSKAKTL